MKTNEEILRHKDGVLTRRVFTGEHSCIIKTFENPEFAREIGNYRLLNSLNIPTLRVIAATERELVLEDIRENPNLRLGRGEDLRDPRVAAAIARWYRSLHDAGKMIDTEGLYDESDLFIPENIRPLPALTGTEGWEAWDLLERHFDEIRALLDSLPRTLTYNDFYWTNLAVSKDAKEALMFDYDLMGRGYAYSDVRNVTVSLSPEAADAFLKAYGPTDPLESAVDEIVSVIVTLILAARREQFPAWAEPSRQALRTELPEQIRKLMLQMSKKP